MTYWKDKMNNKPKYQWILHHTRSTDRVFFGPFDSYEELDLFYSTIANAERIHCSVELLINPFVASYDEWWYNPYDELEKKNPELFKRKAEIK